MFDSVILTLIVKIEKFWVSVFLELLKAESQTKVLANKNHENIDRRGIHQVLLRVLTDKFYIVFLLCMSARYLLGKASLGGQFAIYGRSTQDLIKFNTHKRVFKLEGDGFCSSKRHPNIKILYFISNSFMTAGWAFYFMLGSEHDWSLETSNCPRSFDIVVWLLQFKIGKWYS